MDTIGRQVTTFVTLFMATALIVLMYLIFEPQRRTAASNEQRHAAAERGAHIFFENCIICHGPQGKGVAGAGFPLNTAANRDLDDDRRKFLRTTIARGRLNSTGKLPNMPAFANEEGGPLNAQAVEDVITFLGYGDWTEIPKLLAAAGTPVNAIPTPPGRGTPNGAGATGGQPAVASDDPGAAVFDAAGCAGCHKIAPEYPNGGTTGPVLTGIGGKAQIPTSQPTLPVNEEGLTTWIRDPPAIKPGVLMPAFDESTIPAKEMSDLVKWLLTHK